MLRRLVTAVVVFFVLGIAVSREILTVFGLDSNYLAVGGGGLVLTFMLIFRGFMLLFLVVVLTVGLNMPDQILFDYGIDKVVIMGALVSMVLFPTIHKMLQN